MTEKKQVDKKNLLTRTISGTVIVLILLGFGILGGWFFFAFTLIVSFIGLYEFYKVFGIERQAIGYAGVACAFFYWILLAFNLTKLIFPTVIGTFLVLSTVYVFDFVNTDSIKMLGAYVGFLYTIVLMSYIYRIRTMEDGLFLVYLVFIASWGCDVFAYLVGIVFGKHHMAPLLSPKKTWEGMAGGLAGAAFLGAIYGAIFSDHFTMVKAPVIACCVLCVCAALVSMVGDLFASALKRNHNIKDYSNLIPGHGGILDRFDSCIFVAPLIFFMAELFI